MKRVAMEYSPSNAIPYISRVDAGTVESVRQLGVEVASSGDLVQRFEAVWTDEVLATHVSASEKLYRIKDRAFQLVKERMASGTTVTEFDVQQEMLKWFAEEGLVDRCAAQRLGAGERRQSPLPRHSREAPGDPAQRDRARSTSGVSWPRPARSLLTLRGLVSPEPRCPSIYTRAFAAARDGRDAAIELVQTAVREQRDLRGFQVDRACRDVIERAGFGAQFIHRTGHSLGENVHGDGVHMDDYETHDDRRLIPGTGFTIEPGIYTDTYGVRTEINMFVGEREARVTGPRQQELVSLV